MTPHDSDQSSIHSSKRPGVPGLSPLGLVFDEFSCFDRNRPRLQCLRQFTVKLNMKQSVLKSSTFDKHVVGQLELTLKTTVCNSARQELPLFSRFSLVTGNGEFVLLGLNREFIIFEPRNGHDDSVFIFPSDFNVVRGVACTLNAIRVFKHASKPVKTNSCAI